MTRRKIMIGALIGAGVLGITGLIGLAGHYGVLKDDDDDDDEGGREALIKALRFSKVSLQQGLTASEQEGQTISAKFEVNEGKFQLSVYTVKDGKFSEVLVDHATGKVAKVEPITKGEDIAAANLQGAAMAKAKTSLKDAIDKAIGEADGFRAVSVAPSLKDGHAVASVLVLKGEQVKPIDVSLE